MPLDYIVRNVELFRNDLAKMNYTAAIVELLDGHIILVPADRIQFLDQLGY